MDVNEYIKGLSDDDLRGELYQRNERVRKEAAERRLLHHRAQLEIRDAMRREFCEEKGITFEQFEAVSDYLVDEGEY